MKIRNVILVIIMLSFTVTAAYAQEFGKIRALAERAATIIKKKNDFVAKALVPYAIPHERNDQGIVVRIKVEGRWLTVTGIEIIPVLVELPDKSQNVTAHELFFYTNEGTLALLSDLTIR